MKDKVVIVTGASSGIGRATVLQYASKGSKVVAAARKLELLQELEKEVIEQFNTEILVVKTDVSNPEDCSQLVDQTVKRFGQIDVLVNNAGISMHGKLLDTDIHVIEKVMDVNFRGTLYCTKYALPHILKNKGSIVGVSSIAGYRGLPGRTGYSSSKFAMQGFLEALRTEHIYEGLHVLIFCPGYTASNIRFSALTEKGDEQGESPREENKMMTAEEVASILYKGVVKRKKVITLTLMGKLTVLLNKFASGFMDKVVYNAIAKEKDSPFKRK